jgi:hypothetical protein
MNPRLRTCLLWILPIALAACAAPASGAALWIAAPVNDLELPVGEPVHLEGHVPSSDEVSAIEVWEGDALVATLSDLVPVGELQYFETYWMPTEPGDVVLTAISRRGDESLGEDSVRLHIREELIITPTEVPPVVITPSDITPEVITPEPSLCEPSVTALMNANCRSGPEGVFDVVGYLLEGETATVVGQLADSSWWLIPNPDRPGQCWIASNVVEPACLDEDIPVVAKPPTPVPADDQAPPVPSPAYPVGGQSLACAASVTLAWNPVSDESGISAHQVQLERSSDQSSWNSVSGSPWTTGDGNKLSVNMECGWYYRWRVRVQDGAGNWSEYSSWTYFRMPLT